MFVTTTTNRPPTEFSQAAVRGHAGVDLQAQPVKGLRFGIRVYDDETHHSVAPRSVYDGLAHVFEGYAPSLDTLYAIPSAWKNSTALRRSRLGSEVFRQRISSIVRLRFPQTCIATWTRPCCTSASPRGTT